MFVPEIQTLPPELLFAPAKTGAEAALPEATARFRFGRDAIAWGIEYLGLEAGDRVMIPCSTCDVIVAEFARAGIEMVLYSLDDGLSLSLSDISGRIDARTRAIYVIHYFGFKQDLGPLRDFCNEKRLSIFEDHAHSLFTKCVEGVPKAEGDILIYSYRKFLPIPDGGGVYARGASESGSSIGETVESDALKGAAKLVLKNLLLRTGISFGVNRRNRYALDEDEIIAQAGESVESSMGKRRRHPMSAVSLLISKRIDPATIIRKRRENFMFWLGFARRNPAITPIFSHLPDAVCPYSFPALVAKRNEIVEKMARHCVFLEPTLNPVFKGLRNIVNGEESFPRIESMASAFLSLPVYQDLAASDLERISSRLEKMT